MGTLLHLSTKFYFFCRIEWCTWAKKAPEKCPPFLRTADTRELYDLSLQWPPPETPPWGLAEKRTLHEHHLVCWMKWNTCFHHLFTFSCCCGSPARPLLPLPVHIHCHHSFLPSLRAGFLMGTKVDHARAMCIELCWETGTECCHPIIISAWAKNLHGRITRDCTNESCRFKKT